MTVLGLRYCYSRPFSQSCDLLFQLSDLELVPLGLGVNLGLVLFDHGLKPQIVLHVEIIFIP